MLANDDIREELQYIEKTRQSIKDEGTKASLKALSLVIQLLHNIRTNVVTVMKHQGIGLIKPKEKVENEEEKK